MLPPKQRVVDPRHIRVPPQPQPGVLPSVGRALGCPPSVPPTPAERLILPSPHVKFPQFRSVQSFVRDTYKSASRTTRLTTLTAAAALAAVGAGLSASPAMAATGGLATVMARPGGQSRWPAEPRRRHGTRAVRRGDRPDHRRPAAHASPVARAVALAPVAPVALAPHQLPAQTPKQPVVRIRVATATNKAPHQAAPASHGAAQHSASSNQQHSQHQVQPARPFLIYDSVTPTAIPPHRMVATYATGGYAVPASQVAGRGRVLWIDTGRDPKPGRWTSSSGDATPWIAASSAWHELSATPAAVAPSTRCASRSGRP